MSFKKIVLKSTTVMSLNERFTYLRGNHDHNIHTIRESNALQQQASAKNRRLAQQMERRPAVMAALKLKKRSLRQRLGQPLIGSIKERLSLPLNSRGINNVRGRARGRGPLRGKDYPALGGRSQSTMPLNARDESFRYQRGQGRPFHPGSRRPFKRGRGMIPNRGIRFTRGGAGQRSPSIQSERGGSFRRAGRSGRGIGSMRGRGRRGGPRGRQQNVPSKEELDLQLDQYMANTKSHLDKELDTYMNQAPSESWN